MQFGTVQQWADSVGIDMTIVANIGQTQYRAELYDKKSVFVPDGVYSNRESAQLAAIEKLNLLYNDSQLKKDMREGLTDEEFKNEILGPPPIRCSIIGEDEKQCSNEGTIKMTSKSVLKGTPLYCCKSCWKKIKPF